VALILNVTAAFAGLPHAEPESVGIDGKHLARIDEIVAQDWQRSGCRDASCASAGEAGS